MELSTKEKIEKFLTYYHDLHDSYITSLSYDVSHSKIEAVVDVYWSGKPILKEDNSYETNPKKIKLAFFGIEKANIREIYCDISCAYLEFITLDGKKFICFADDKDEPSFYVVCDRIEYAEIGGKNENIY